MILKSLDVSFFGTCCYILSWNDKEAVIIDPGGEVEKIINVVEENNLTPVTIINTHGHIDHIGANKELKQYFSDIPIAIGEIDAKYLGMDEAARNVHFDDSLLLGFPQFFSRFFKPSPAASILLKENEEIFKLKVILTPGHTAGGISLLGDSFIFTGDTLFAQGIGRTDLGGGDYDTLLDSIRTKLFTLPQDLKVLPGHGPSTTIGNEMKYNPFVRLETY
ncbi:MAG: MBL fold metallo-hydrolase [Candidatus Hodarchaeota archaeon]